jgi:hypothetical protein
MFLKLNKSFCPLTTEFKSNNKKIKKSFPCLQNKNCIYVLSMHKNKIFAKNFKIMPKTNFFFIFSTKSSIHGAFIVKWRESRRKKSHTWAPFI